MLSLSKKVQNIGNSTNDLNQRYFGRKLVRVSSIANFEIGANQKTIK